MAVSFAVGAIVLQNKGGQGNRDDETHKQITYT